MEAMTLSGKPEGVGLDSPYVPEGMPEWKAGMHVGWRISPECPCKCEKCGLDFHHRGSQGEGVLGAAAWSIARYCAPLEGGCGKLNPANNHDYFIDVDRGDGFWASGSELIPLSDEGRER